MGKFRSKEAGNGKVPQTLASSMTKRKLGGMVVYWGGAGEFCYVSRGRCLPTKAGAPSSAMPDNVGLIIVPAATGAVESRTKVL